MLRYLLLVCLLGSLSLASAAPPPPSRYSDLARLWGTVAYFHPNAISHAPQWDRAFAGRLPLLLNAGHDDYVAGLRELLGTLGDPVTRLDEQPQPAPASRHRFRCTGLVCTLDLRAPVPAESDLIDLLDALPGRLPPGARLTVDLRHLTAAEAEALFETLRESGFFDSLTAVPLEGVHDLRLAWRGHPSEQPNRTSPFYRPVWIAVKDGAVPGGEEPLPAPVTVRTSPHIALPAELYALAHAGRIRIVGGPTVSGSVESLVLEDGIRVCVRRSLYRRHNAFPSLAAGRPSAHFPPQPFPEPGWRFLAAARIWAVAVWFEAYAAEDAAEWNRRLQSLAPAFLEASNAAEYGAAVAAMTRLFADAHVWSVPPDVRKALAAKPDLELRRIENMWLVAAAPAGAGVRAGDEIVSVDGVPADRLAQERSSLFPNPRTEVNHRFVADTLLSGLPQTSAAVTVRSAGGTLSEVRLPRLAGPPPSRSGPAWRLLNPETALVDLGLLQPAATARMMRELAGVSSLIFDLRSYPRGAGWALAAHLARTGRPLISRIDQPWILGPYAQRAMAPVADEVPAAHGSAVQGRWIALVDERTQSQGEHTAMILAALGARLVGSPTAGADGEVTSIRLPGGIGMTFSGMAVRRAGGERFHRIGLQPDVVVRPTVAGIRAGRDEVLEAALELLASQR
ncbi:MAG TPA: hypothetical protein DEH78_08145 [Solibacterales bacterium]|nr:hypothetical protein [Bryobacterales bacterium]